MQYVMQLCLIGQVVLLNFHSLAAHLVLPLLHENLVKVIRTPQSRCLAGDCDGFGLEVGEEGVEKISIVGVDIGSSGLSGSTQSPSLSLRLSASDPGSPYPASSTIL